MNYDTGGIVKVPIGVIVNALAIALGGIIGAVSGERLDDQLKEKLSLIFGICAMGMGISSIMLMENMPAVILAVIIGTTIGLLCHFGKWIENMGTILERLIAPLTKGIASKSQVKNQNTLLITAIVLFCASRTGIYGSIDSGMTGDQSILIAKSVLDIFTALIFACSLGIVVSLIAIPQFIIFIFLYLMAGYIYPHTTLEMISDFKACGGFLLLATSIRMLKLKEIPIADMIPAMAFVMPCSFCWTEYILPLL